MNVHKWQVICFLFLCILFTHKEVQMTPVTIGYKNIDSFHENAFYKMALARYQTTFCQSWYTHQIK